MDASRIRFETGEDVLAFQLEDIRRDKPYELEDRVERLFHEKSMTGYSAWNRQFDETINALKFKVGISSRSSFPAPRSR